MNQTEIQQSVIGRIFCTRGGLSLAASYVEAKSLGMSGEWFSDLRCKTVWDAADEESKSDADFKIVPLRKRTEKLLAERKKTSRNYADVIIDEPFFEECSSLSDRTSELADAVKLMRDQFVSRCICDEFETAKDSLKSGVDVVSTASNLQAKIGQILKDTNPAKEIDGCEGIIKVSESLDEARRQLMEMGNIDYVPGMRLPWDYLTKSIGGYRSATNVIAARPSVGKTSFVLHMIRYWCENGIKVCFDSLDMPAEQVYPRLIAAMADVRIGTLEGGMFDDYQAELKNEAVKKLCEWVKSGTLKIFEESNVQIMRSQVKMLRDQGKIDVFVVDYLQKMRCPGTSKEYDRVTECCTHLHQMSQEEKLPVIELAQLNRDNTKDGGREPELTDLRSSGQIEQDANTVILLHRESSVIKSWETNRPLGLIGNPNNPDEVNDLDAVVAIVSKAQNGRAGTHAPFIVDKPKFTWYSGDSSARGEERYARVYDDGRTGRKLEMFDRNGSLIHKSDRQRSKMDFVNSLRAKRGLPPIGSLM